MDIGKAIELFTQRMHSKNWSKSTIKNYSSQVYCFLTYFKSVPKAKEISANNIEQYLLTKVRINSRNHARCGIQAFYTLAVGQPMKLQHIPWPKKEKKLPQPLEAQEIQRLLNVCQNLKHKTIICLLYGCGLRISEVLNLKIAHVDSPNMILHIIAAKGKKDRIVPIDENLLQQLRKYYLAYKPTTYLFNGQNGLQYSERSINSFLKENAEKAGINKNVHAHLLRHCYATHALDYGTDIVKIQKLLGHSNLKTTLIYTHVSANALKNVVSPLNQLSY
jgi:integrase/recombinase XerD